MSLLEAVSRQGEIPPLRMNIQGTDGIGKSTFGTGAPDPIFIQAEDGLSYLDVDRFPLCNTWSDLMDQVETLYKDDHQWKTVVLDTTDAAGNLCEQHVCEDNSWKSIQAPGWGKGPAELRLVWAHLLDGLNALRVDRQMNVILLSHVEAKIFSDPSEGDYNRWEMRCDKNVNALIKDWVDFNFFANYELNKISDKQERKNRAIAYGKRKLFTSFNASFDAKSRLELPKELEFTWESFADAYTKALSNQQSKAA